MISAQTSSGGKGIASTGAYGNAAAGQTANGNKYAAANGNVYKNPGSGWNQTQGQKSTSSYSGANSAAARGWGGQQKSSGSSAFGGGGSGWQSREASARGSASGGGGGHDLFLCVGNCSDDSLAIRNNDREAIRCCPQGLVTLILFALPSHQYRC